jgi:predicted Zn-dependent peptidase
MPRRILALLAFAGGLFAQQKTVAAGRTHDAMAAILRELRALAGEKPVTQEELDSAKEYAVRNWPLAFQWAGSTIDRIAETWLYDKSLAEIGSFPGKIAAVTLGQVNAAVRKYVPPHRAVFLFVGDPEKIGAVDRLVTLK